MTITTNPSRDEYTSTAGQTVFNYTFKIYANTDLNVYVTPSGQSPDDSADLTTDYVVDPGTIGDESGGFITFNSPLNAGDAVTIVSSIPYDRTVDYQNNGDFLPATVNNDNDRQVSQIKQILEQTGRTLQFPESLQSASILALPVPIANNFLKWKSDLSGLENVELVDGALVVGNGQLLIFPTVAALKASTSPLLVSGVNVKTQGRNAAGDGLGAYYLVVPPQVPGPNDETLNNGNIVVRQSRQAEQISIDPTGTSLTSTDTQSAVAELDSNVTQVKPRTKNSAFYRANMHFDCLKGLPWVAGEAGGLQTYSVASNALVGDMTIDLVDATGIIDNQLICYLSSDGEYYSAGVKNLSGNTVNLRTPIESNLLAGGEVYNFYVNSSHPNNRGNRTICDYAIRDAALLREVVSFVKPSELQATNSNIALFSVNDRFKPGSALNEFATVTATPIGGGCYSQYTQLPQGLYEARILVSPGTGAATTLPANIDVLVDQDRQGATSVVATKSVIGEECTQVVKLRFTAAQESNYRVRIVSTDNADTTFSVGKIQFNRITDNQLSLDYGTHVLFGDSWFVFDGFEERIVARLPNATIINEGVGGNQVGDLLARYNTSVTDNDPDFVWLTCGTNDYSASTALDSFDSQMNVIRTNNVTIGATTITIDPSVGDTTVGNNFQLSRDYAIRGTYDVGADVYLTPFNYESDQYSSGWSLAAGASVVVAASRNTVTGDCLLESSYFIGAAGINLTVGFATNLVLAVEDTVVYGAETIQSTPVKVPKSTGAPRYLTVTLTNTTGAPITVSGFVKIKWN